MKTKELIEKIKYSHYNSVVSANSKETQILSVFVNGKIVAQFSHLGSWLNFENDCPKEVAHWLVEYVKTPLSEREEEKKYQLIVHNDFTFIRELQNYTQVVEYIQTKEGKRKFTQKEIDAMPFDTNLFIKEEV